MQFLLEHEDKSSKARAGLITTSKGEIRTPIFMPVGTVGSVKSIPQNILEEQINADIILGNTYHLYLRPGTNVLDAAGGLHHFMGWNRPILTDSGGYQVHSLVNNRKITEKGVTFRSHLDGSKHLFTPESVVDIQRSIGSDIMMVLDECTPYPCSYIYAKESMKRTHRWMTRGCGYFDATLTDTNAHQTLFPIVQGSVYKDLRIQSAETIAAANRPGNAIGGVCHPTGQLYEITELVCDILPKSKPRYLMGVGTPLDLLECIGLGVDMFDCVMPTRNGRNGTLFTTQGIINIKNKKWKTDFSPIDAALGGLFSSYYSKAYLSHLITSKELLGAQIASVHNLTFYLWLVRQAREQIIQNNFAAWKNHMLKKIMEKI
ncbi:tRNA guanosine(34) transglycosylase Tgt [Cardinium endosymbiont of Tipula unca]|uniref:tRNA guanosine(34) transglycosylase Tgt n=1 Tax=Cardinium endosymbiont of Tipula unca TaxID=3066216 RepID=UPI0030D1FFBB